MLSKDSHTAAKTKDLPKILYVVGHAGAGKGTQCSKVVEKYGAVHISIGELLRRELGDETSPYRELIDSVLSQHKLVPMHISSELMSKPIEQLHNSEKPPPFFMLDGFPRSLDNYFDWARAMSGKISEQGALLLDGDVSVFIERCLTRKGQNRTDDNIRTLEIRQSNFEIDSMPVIEYFRDKGMLWSVDAMGTVDQVFDRLEQLLMSKSLL